MADVRCPTCGETNPANTEICQFCGARLQPPEDQSIHPGEQPVKKVTSELEKVSTPGGKTPIHPGDAPTKKDTGELERALPTWLQSIRKGEEKPAAETPAEPAPDADMPASPGDSTPPAAASGDLPDWLAGLKSGAEEEEEVPDWLAGIRNKIGTESGAPSEDETPSQPQGEEGYSHPGQPASGEKAAPSAPAEEAAPAEGLPSWFTGLDGAGSGPEVPAAPASSEPEWMTRLKEETYGLEAGPELPPAEIPDWLSGIPAGLSAAVEKTAEPPTPSETPEWLKNLQPESGAPTEAPAVKPFETGELPPIGTPAPDWLSQLQAEASQEPSDQGFQPVSELAKREIPAEPIPDWLTGLKEAGVEDETPAAIQEEKSTAPQAEPAGMVSMDEQPAWLSTLKPDEGEKTPTPQAEAGEDLPDSLEKAELPSWVQAMRPVDAVMADVEQTPLDTDQPPEQGGPLAGLRGVLPGVPGLGPLRKPPAYSIKLQVGENQQSHASHLERIIANEAEPRAIRNQAHIFSARLLRWVIALVLILAIGGTVATGGQFVPAGALYPSEMLPTMKVIDELPSNSPVLVVFDYQPALSGEMEAAAAPLIDHLLFSGARLTLLSTSPTGPALAERFLQNTQAGHNYQAGQQYVNLGYLSGGPAGILDFAQNPVVAAPYSVDGQSAWQMPLLQGVRQLSDFSAVIVLTDDADTGRTWIEQTGPVLGQTPMLMIISAQAEPMIRPYFDSGQLKGLVAGLAGGKAYEQAMQRPGPAGAYWNSFSVGMLAAELMIVIGATWSAISAWRERRLARKGEQV